MKDADGVFVITTAMYGVLWGLMAFESWQLPYVAALTILVYFVLGRFRR